MPVPAVAVIGLGAFGRNHLRVYRELETAGLCTLAAAVDPSAAARDLAAQTFAVPTFASVDDLFAAVAVTACSVCVPTVHHAAVASLLLQAGVDTLIEKPFAATLAEADALTALADSGGRILQVGHLERFNPAVTAALAHRARPLFFEVHRLSVFTPRSLDVDVVLDLMIHDLDIVLTLAASPVRELRAVGLPVLSPNVDIANVRLEFASGCVANFTASRVSTEQVRKLRYFEPHRYISLDFARQELFAIDVERQGRGPRDQGPGSTKQEARTGDQGLGIREQGLEDLSLQKTLSSRPESQSHRDAAERPAIPASNQTSSFRPERAARSGETPVFPAQTPHPSAGLALHKYPIERAEPLRLELEDFLRAVTTRTPPRVTAQQGRAALALALEINAAIAAHTGAHGPY